jgi:hypothetical protein
MFFSSHFCPFDLIAIRGNKLAGKMTTILRNDNYPKQGMAGDGGGIS